MLSDALAALVVLAVVVYLWVIGPVRWFRGDKKRPLPDVWVC